MGGPAERPSLHGPPALRRCTPPWPLAHEEATRPPGLLMEYCRHPMAKRDSGRTFQTSSTSRSVGLT